MKHPTCPGPPDSPRNSLDTLQSGPGYCVNLIHPPIFANESVFFGKFCSSEFDLSLEGKPLLSRRRARQLSSSDPYMPSFKMWPYG